MKYLILLTGFCVLSSAAHGQTCFAPSRRSSELTRFGGNQLITMIERKVLAGVRGRVSDVNGSPIDDALVEIYEKPDWIKNGGGPATEQKRIIGCKVGEGGQFEIRGLGTNSYELRVSVSGGFNVTHVFISVDPRRGSRKRLELIASVGT